ncbi:hypothetical protein Leryth_019766 [Lithospermum erythrorhizon]|nr:hypothetical protein Leryth_019766 [Lithospermum erythrorhizon]
MQCRESVGPRAGLRTCRVEERSQRSIRQGHLSLHGNIPEAQSGCSRLQLIRNEKRLSLKGLELDSMVKPYLHHFKTLHSLSCIVISFVFCFLFNFGYDTLTHCLLLVDLQQRFYACRLEPQDSSSAEKFRVEGSG